MVEAIYIMGSKYILMNYAQNFRKKKKTNKLAV